MKTKSAVRIIGALFILALLFGLWYDVRFSMTVIDSKSYNNPESEKKILIASQGSDYKDAFTTSLIRKIEDSIYIQLVDVTTLPEVDTKQFDLFILIHTWEVWKAPAEVVRFVEPKNHRERTFLLGTSGGGELSIDGVDGITSASIKSDIDGEVKLLLSWITDHIDR